MVRKARRLLHHRDQILYRSKSHYRAAARHIPHSAIHGAGSSDEIDATGLKVWNHIDVVSGVTITPGDFIQADLSVRGSFIITAQETSFENDGRICVIQRKDDGQLGTLTVAKTGGDQILGALCEGPVDSFDLHHRGDVVVLSWDLANKLVKLY